MLELKNLIVDAWILGINGSWIFNPFYFLKFFFVPNVLVGMVSLLRAAGDHYNCVVNKDLRW